MSISQPKERSMKINLAAIQCESNIRRASPILASEGIDVLNICRTLGLSYSENMWMPFIRMVCKDHKLVSLARSLSLTGQIHPIIVTKSKDATDKSYQCLSGQRRYIAMVLLECVRKVLRFDTADKIMEVKSLINGGEIDLPSIDFDKMSEIEDELQLDAELKEIITEEQAERLAFSANEEAEPLTDIDWALWLAKATERINPATKEPYTLAELSKICGKSEWWLKQRKPLVALPKEWQNAVDKREVTISKATAYALEIMEGAEDDRPEVVVSKALPSLDKVEEIYDLDDSKESEKDFDEEEVDSVDFGGDSTTEMPVKDIAEGKRKKRNSSPKIMKYNEVVELLVSLPKSDQHGIGILAKVLKINLDEAMELIDSKELTTT